MTRVVLGNRNATDSKDDGATREALPAGKRATVIDAPDGQSIGETFRVITDPQGVWGSHATEGATPAWVASDSAGLAALLAEHFGAEGKPLEVRDLLDPYDPETAKPAAKKATSSGGSSRRRPSGPMLSMMLTVAVVLGIMQQLLLALKVNTGHDFQARQMGGTASATNVAIYVGLTANVTAPAAGDTTLTAEITTGGGGLIRKAGTYAHTTGAANYTVTTVFTANGSDTLPVTIGKRGIFDQITGGLLVFSTLVTPTATLSASGDSLTLTDTISL